MNDLLTEAFVAIQQLPQERQHEMAMTLLNAALPSID
jgi:hypothetical protein